MTDRPTAMRERPTVARNGPLRAVAEAGFVAYECATVNGSCFNCGRLLPNLTRFIR